MPAQKPTPEEKLFAVIQGAHQPSPRARAQALSLATVGMQLKTLAVAVDLPRVNQALSALVALLGVACLLNPLLLRPRVERILAQAAQRVTPFVIPPPFEGMGSTEAYVELTRAQDPFRIGDVPPALPLPIEDATQPPLVPTAPPGPNPQELVSDFRLVGIARGGAVPRVMIEQISQQTTHILKIGDPIGGFTVKEILDDRVVLQVGEQEVDLF